MRLLALLGLAAGLALAASQNPYYISQSGAGSANGNSCGNAYSVTTFNNVSNWGTGATQIGPDTVVHLCGTFTTSPAMQGSGSSGHPITVLWESGARVSPTFGQMFYVGGFGFFVFDGGVPCGPATSCAALEAANPTGWVSGMAGTIEATANGSSLAHQDASTDAFWGCNNCHDIEVKNLIARNLYQHTSPTDDTASADTGNFVFQCPQGSSGCAAGTIYFHDMVVHDTGNAFSLERAAGSVITLDRIEAYRNNWLVEDSGDGTRTLTISNNHVHDVTNWDTNDDKFHHNFLHQYQSASTVSVKTFFYNNLSDGDWGSCCTTATMIYQEFTTPNNMYVFNNVNLQKHGNTAAAFINSGLPMLMANNTLIGDATTGGNTESAYPGATLSFENNAIEGYGVYLSIYGPGLSLTALDYNAYGAIGMSGNTPWAFAGTGYSSFSTWKTACSCDAHGVKASTLNVNSSGVPQAGSSLISAGLNLTSLGIPALNSDTTAGGTRTAIARPTGTTAWDIGAFQYSAGPFAPSVTTTTASVITSNSASAGGTVTNNGGASVISEGTCYGLTANPTSPCTSDGTGTPFTSSLTGLSSNTLYHYRAKATNSVGTSYGVDLTFTTGIVPIDNSIAGGNQVSGGNIIH